MSVRRTTLDVLTRPRLRDIALVAGVEFYANTSRADMLDSISRSHSIPFRAILAEYLRDELKLACQQLELDETGRDKTVLIRRLLAAEKQTLKTRERSPSANRNGRQRTQITRVSRSRGTSAFLDGVNDMEEPKEIAEPTTPELQEEPSRVELVWPGKRREVDRVVLPFQCIEIVNESRATREAEKAMPLAKSFKANAAPGSSSAWRNKLIWGDNKYVLGSLLDQYSGQVDLIYIDPPFATGQDFSFQVDVGEESITKEPSLIEEKAYRDTWGSGLESYLQMLYERMVLARGLLSGKGSLYVHLDDTVSPYVKVMLDELFGADHFNNQIVWRRTGSNTSPMRYGRNCDFILFYSKSVEWTWNTPKGEYDPEYVESHYTQKEPDGRRYQLVSTTGAGATKNDYLWNGIRPPAGRHWAYSKDKMEQLKAQGRLVESSRGGPPRVKYYLDEQQGPPLQCLWSDIKVLNSQSTERVNYDTQKPETLVRRIIEASSAKDSLVMDFFCGSGTTMVAAEKTGRRWIGCDLSRWAVQVSRKRLLDTEGCRPFEVLNLGKYERQYWQGVTFGKGHGQQKALHEYVRFVLELYRAEPTSGLANIHGQRGGCMIHVGAADSPVTLAEIREAVDECKKINQAKLDILGWEWEMGLHDVVEAESKRAGVKLRLLQIPRECMDQRAVDAGDVHFYELAYLEVEAERHKGTREVRINLKNFVIPSPELIPDDVRSKIKKWSDFIDYWSVDFEFNEDVFHNQWQDYRTRSKRDLELTTDWHEYPKGGAYKVLVKVFDIFGNDTTQLLEVRA